MPWWGWLLVAVGVLLGAAVVAGAVYVGIIWYELRNFSDS